MSLAAKGIVCERNHISLFQSASFTLYPGEMVQVLGCNGAGKSSLLRILSGLLQPIEGEIFWRNELIINSEQYAHSLLYIGHTLGIRDNLSVKEYFDHTIPGKKWNQAELIQALTQLQLMPFLNQPCGLLSQGQRQRLALVRCFFSSEMVWIIDEPFANLDREAIGFVEEMLKNHAIRGGLVIIATHREIVMKHSSRQVVLSPQLILQIAQTRDHE